MGIEEIIGEKRALIRQIAAQYGASNVRVFGSVARGEATSESDVDLLIEQDWSQLSGWGGMELAIALEDLLQRKVDIATLEELRPAIRERVIKEAVVL